MYIHDALHGLLPTDMVERSLAGQHLVGQDPNSPDIHKIVIGLSLKNLGTNIIQSATIGVSPLLTVNGPPKVTQLANTLNNTKST